MEETKDLTIEPSIYSINIQQSDEFAFNEWLLSSIDEILISISSDAVESNEIISKIQELSLNLELCETSQNQKDEFIHQLSNIQQILKSNDAVSIHLLIMAVKFIELIKLSKDIPIDELLLGFIKFSLITILNQDNFQEDLITQLINSTVSLVNIFANNVQDIISFDYPISLFEGSKTQNVDLLTAHLRLVFIFIKYNEFCHFEKLNMEDIFLCLRDQLIYLHERNDYTASVFFVKYIKNIFRFNIKPNVDDKHIFFEIFNTYYVISKDTSTIYLINKINSFMVYLFNKDGTIASQFFQELNKEKLIEAYENIFCTDSISLQIINIMTLFYKFKCFDSIHLKEHSIFRWRIIHQIEQGSLMFILDFLLEIFENWISIPDVCYEIVFNTDFLTQIGKYIDSDEDYYEQIITLIKLVICYNKSEEENILKFYQSLLDEYEYTEFLQNFEDSQIASNLLDTLCNK